MLNHQAWKKITTSCNVIGHGFTPCSFFNPISIVAAVSLKYRARVVIGGETMTP